MKPKVLILPTYWPTLQAPIVGSQVKEQAEVMFDKFDIKTIYCISGMGWKRLIILLTFGWLFKKKIYTKCDKLLRGGKISSYGVFYYNNKILPDTINQFLKNKAYAFVLSEMIKNNWKPNLIHSRTAEKIGLQAAYISKQFQITYLLTENCIFILDENITTKRIRNYRYAIETADKVAVVSHYLKAFLLSHDYKCEPTIVGNMVNEEFFTISNIKKQTEDYNIFTAGHTGFTKDWKTFFKVIQSIVTKKSIKNLKVTIAVTSVYDEYSENLVPNLAKKYNVEEYCDIRTHVSRDNMVKLFHQADMFLSTSVNETFGIATLEAMFCGVPVVSTRNGGIEDFSTPENSVLCNIGDHEALSNAIIDIYENKHKFNAETVRNSVINKYGKDAFKKRLTQLYLETINNDTPQ